MSNLAPPACATPHSACLRARRFESAERAHLAKIDKLINIHERRLRKLEAEFEQSLRGLKSEVETERTALVTKHARDVRQAKRVITAVETEERRKAEEAQQLHETQREEIKNKNLVRKRTHAARAAAGHTAEHACWLRALLHVGCGP